jgi:hypothetical protein
MSENKEVKSENQSGGITGYNVNVGDNADFSSSKETEQTSSKSKFWKTVGYIALIATIISTIIGLLTYFEI